MKKSVFQNSLVVAIMLSCMALNATGATITESVLAKASEPMKFILSTSSIKSEKVRCTIISEEGRQVYADRINTEKVSNRLFDMSNLPEGIYTVEIEDDLKIDQYQLIVHENSIELSQNADEICKPVFNMMPERKVGMTLLSLGNDVKVELSDGSDVFYTLRVNEQDAIQKVFDTDHLPKGKYHFKIVTSDRVFYHSVNI